MQTKSTSGSLSALVQFPVLLGQASGGILSHLDTPDAWYMNETWGGK